MLDHAMISYNYIMSWDLDPELLSAVCNDVEGESVPQDISTEQLNSNERQQLIGILWCQAFPTKYHVL